MKEPTDYIIAFEAELADVLKQENNNEEYPCSIGFTGTFGKYYVTPRNLLCDMIGRVVSVEGIVTKSSLVLPKLVQTVSWCPKSKKHHLKDFRDHLSLSGTPTGFTYPKKDIDGNPLETEFGLSRYKDTQVLYIQEMPERAPAGQLPRSVECVVEEDLVDFVKPGDRVQLVGVYKAVGGLQSGGSSGVMRTVLLVNNIQQIGNQTQDPKLTTTDIAKIRELSKNKDIFSLLAKSMAPSIFGHEIVKRALLLQLFGGVEKKIVNTKLRGDINVLMVGDPSTAKSQLLRFMMNLAPLAISTTGRASSGVGLTAAIVQDSTTGQRTLQAGAMVLADRGIVCIDEFDKMSDVDRVALHEAMEQQTVTIAKAGVHTTLNARCSVVAAANPLFGQYNGELTVQRNINLPDSLLSRFDLVFVVLDKKDSTLDREIADHVLNIHMIKDSRGGFREKSLMSQELEENEKEDQFSVIRGKKIFSISFLRKYIYYVKHRSKPILTQAASEMISEIYCELRKTSTQKTLPITPRSLETLIRLSSAHAKIRMSNEVTEDDVSVIFKILEYALTFTTKAVPLPPQNKRKETDTSIEPSAKRDKPEEPETSSENDRKEQIKTKMVQMFRESRGETVEMDDLLKEVSKQYKYTEEEFKAIVDAILEANDSQFMREGPTIYRL